MPPWLSWRIWIQQVHLHVDMKLEMRNKTNIFLGHFRSFNLYLFTAFVIKRKKYKGMENKIDLKLNNKI